MTVRETFDDALNRAIDGLRSGRPLDAVLLDHPAHASALRPLLDAAASVTAEQASAAPPSTRLAGNFTIVRAAVQRAQIAERAAEAQSVPRTSTPWWRRSRTMASLTLPVGVIVALALAGVGGAAAATVAVTGGDIPGRLAHAITPDWIEQHVPGVGNGGANGSPPRNIVGDRTPAGGNAPVIEITPSPNPGEANAPQSVTVSGLISDAHGNVFTLTTADGAWNVKIDGSTVVSGEITNGATASVTGDATAEKNLHATAVEVAAAPAGANTPQPTGPEPKTPADRTPGPPAKKTPESPTAHTPPGQPDDSTPPAQNGDGGGNDNGGDNADKDIDEAAKTQDDETATGGGNVKP